MATQALSAESLPNTAPAPTIYDHLRPTGYEQTIAATVVGLAQKTRVVHMSNGLLRQVGDQDTITHQNEVALGGAVLGLRLGYSYGALLAIAIGDLVHDTGKGDLQIQRTVVNSPTNMRDPNVDEPTRTRFRRAQERHTELGAEILDRVTSWPADYEQDERMVATKSMAVEFAGGHHMYKPAPYGIPPKRFVEETQRLAVVDILHAIVSARVYKPAFSPDVVVEEVAGEFRGEPHILEAAFPELSSRRQPVL